MSKSERINFGKLKEIITPPNLIENQLDSYEEFLQKDVAPSKRKNLGLEAVFREVFPVESYDGRCSLQYVSYNIIAPKLSEIECLREGSSYSVSLYVTLKLVEEGVERDEEIYMGEIPMITKSASFIINGAERVVVSQLHRSPGICFEEAFHTSGKALHSFRIIPDRGTWLEVQFDQNDLLYIYLDRRRRRRKFLITTLLRAMGYGKDSDILNLFYKLEKLNLKKAAAMENVSNLVLVEDIVDAEQGIVLARAFEPLTKTIVRSFIKARIDSVNVIDTSIDDGAIIRSLKKDPTRNEEEALKDIYKRLRPGEPTTTANARALIKRLFNDPKRYDLGRVGRYKLNQKLGLNIDLETRIIVIDDIIAATNYLVKLKRGEGIVDDIDHLGSRRVRTVGELVANQCRVGLSRTERLVKERMTLYDQSADSISPQKLINPKALSTVIRDFFARSQLSQFMDQINPLAEITHKRRLSALGPGGLNRDRAGFEVRDVHPSHYGRICPIETPEGPNIGLINSLSTYSQINEFGFIETPYRVVTDSVVTDEVHYLTADQEESFVIAQANSEIDDKGKLQGKVAVRLRDMVLEVQPSEVHYMDVSPKQLVSVAAGIIPFLEHDDANRALMGSNMQRQGVPLLQTEAPFVGTGLERKVVEDSGTVIISESKGVVASVDANQIVVTKDGKMPRVKPDEALQTDVNQELYVYGLRKFMRSNAATCFNQKPIVCKGQPVKKGQVIADGASSDNGELALGRNVLVAFMPWNGYNFEDAILLSEKLIKDDVFTSIHIEEFDVAARDTKLGPEEITRDIPNIGEEALKNLDRNGVIRIGAEVKPGDILVGKITPKSETELAPEEKLLRAIFGEKAADVKDTSLDVPSGIYGIVMDVKVSTRIDGEREKLSPSDKRRQLKRINEEFKNNSDQLRDELTESLSNILLGEKIPLDVFNAETGEVVIPANRKITKTLLRKLAAISDNIQIDPSPVRIKIMEIVDNFQRRFQELEEERSVRVKNVESGEGIEAGVIKNVKVYIATKRKIQVGDKMAGRHGNKGVVAKIVAEEDMPFLPDGTPIEIVLNPLGVPSRMNVGQVLETHLGWACKKLNLKVATPVFDGISEKRIREYLEEAKLPYSGKSQLYDGQTGEPFDQHVVVGYIYMMKLNHLVADKIHARAVGPYSLITQQPLGGKAQYGGQRFGEMEVWALEAYGAAYTLQELLTVKSDDVQGRTKIYEALVKGDNSLSAGTPQSFNVLMKEIQSLCLDVRLGTDEK
ncbi:MAG: DNA-directed RNA polymerase subunit beta [Verrucomicrobia bacterium CG_4_10_14_3_um_filter_43_23]|nr:MAG: DNA-directed RNA polymerase subunit beta [Verrucomicrobia bacterium CG1_02_43_26]PIP59621.1 MAG: DNA-directed RNA polymerase subunit beta [Verrucomicrobia bacterium CG22_combo_CG10-13_8_21_14_all_43_17]PIX58920.1 MAG: DNA-directed RNA polymerase subunit beta [Verrucomicrobia bacterium CG_4_10_14_3_um_filter_43_23]PIY61696.1 MAG: DNA-directed RNA polymerase subunit beta [Verrucomicrobia bacterium CG_4_10_14_0_8_um_filter_43_34]PJA44580.1 MAG: DNA-directed RNA polymerase subunit beta [Ver